MPRRKEKKYHFLYKTTCLITNKFYIGMHSTDNLEDGYLGSGKRLGYSINKHGKENHKIEILEFFENREKLKVKETEIINEDLLQDPMCMNLQLGGGGGFSSKEHMMKCSLAGAHSPGRIKKSQKRYKWLIDNDSIWNKKHSEMRSRLLKERHKNGDRGIYWNGKHHSEETKQKIGKSVSESQKGDKNSQYGTCWITNEIETRKIHKGDLIPEGWRLGRKIKRN